MLVHEVNDFVKLVAKVYSALQLLHPCLFVVPVISPDPEGLTGGPDPLEIIKIVSL